MLVVQKPQREETNVTCSDITIIDLWVSIDEATLVSCYFTPNESVIDFQDKLDVLRTLGGYFIGSPNYEDGCKNSFGFCKLEDHCHTSMARMCYYLRGYKRKKRITNWRVVEDFTESILRGYAAGGARFSYSVCWFVMLATLEVRKTSFSASDIQTALRRPTDVKYRPTCGESRRSTSIIIRVLRTKYDRSAKKRDTPNHALSSNRPTGQSAVVVIPFDLLAFKRKQLYKGIRPKRTDVTKTWIVKFLPDPVPRHGNIRALKARSVPIKIWITITPTAWSSSADGGQTEDGESLLPYTNYDAIL
ncbi:hypothetical protein J6590_078763 [Homalodisca vitripennis]|nr:hypothetical protein J6590_078763 [Homalodisca vitripennis]